MAFGAKTAEAFLLLPNGRTHEVAAEIKGSGGGNDQTRAWADFYLHLPLEPAQRDAEARRALARLESEIAKDKSHSQKKLTDEEMQRGVTGMAELVFQHRVGHFRVVCNLAQGDRSLGTGELEFEVLDKGRFSDMWPFPATP